MCIYTNGCTKLLCSYGLQCKALLFFARSLLYYSHHGWLGQLQEDLQALAVALPRLGRAFSRGHKGHSTAPCNNTVAFMTPCLAPHVAYVGGQCLSLWNAGQLQLAVCLVVGLYGNMLRLVLPVNGASNHDDHLTEMHLG